MKHGFLVASPDELLETNGLVEVKFASSKRFLELTEAAKEDEAKKMKAPGVKGLSHRHSFYYQIQGQLHITQRIL
ncbi:unnamed protein product [Ixodes pacificus]